MDFDDTVAFLHEQVGRTIEVGVEIPGYETPDGQVAWTGGQVESVKPTGGRAVEVGAAWRVWFVDRSLGEGFAIRRDQFESADIEAHPPPADERGESGTWWTLAIRQVGVVFDVVIYA